MCILCKLEQMTHCQWTLNVSIQATLLNPAEVRNGEFCCCDSQMCREEFANLPNCFEESSDCETQVTVMLSGCGQCPGEFCRVLDIDDSAVVNITNSSFQIPDMVIITVSEISTYTCEKYSIVC